MSQTPHSNTKNKLEWTIFGLSCLLITGVVGALVWLGLNTEDGPAELEITLSKPVAENGRVIVPVLVKNSGRGVASNVQVVIIAHSGGTERQAEFSLDFVPRSSTRKGTVSFSGSQLPNELRWEVIGYSER